MFRNFFLIALRHIRKEKFYAAINATGLAVGIACCLLIMLYVIHELSYERHQPYAERTYRGLSDLKFGEMEGVIGIMPAPFAKGLRDEFPEVEHTVRFRSGGSFLVRREGEQNFTESRVIFADASMLEVFDFEVLRGNPGARFEEKNTLVITERLAHKYFGDENPVGKILILDDKREFEIVGVVADPPINTAFAYDIYISMESRAESRQQLWLSHNFPTYFVLKEGTDPEAFESKLNLLVEKYVGPQAVQFMGLESFEELAATENRIGYKMQPLLDMHLYSSDLFDMGQERTGDIKYVWLFGAIAVLILVIACINFMNLSTARSAQRAREVGVRKVLGSLRSQLVFQFLTESVLMALISFALAVGLARLALPYFNALSGLDLSIPWGATWFLPAMAVSALGVGLLAGLYPAFLLSGYKPVEVLKGGPLRTGSGTAWIRSTLVVIQFAASIGLIVGSIVVWQQLNYISNKKLGYQKDQVLLLRDTYTLGEKVYTFRDELKKIPGVASATVSSFQPTPSSRTNNAFWREGSDRSTNSVILQNWRVDFDYISTLGMEIVEGRSFSREFSTDSQAVILNKTAVKQFGLGPDPIGKSIVTFAYSDEMLEEQKFERYQVIGVLDNFHFESMKENIAALGLFIGRSTGRMAVKLTTDDFSQTLELIKAKWKEFAPMQAINYGFMDEDFDRLYRTEQRLSKLVLTFSLLAIFVACLGLFALAAFTAQQRTKEIGVRKVLGATINQIVLLLSKDFLKLVLIAILVAVPVSWYLIHNWLASFAYRVDFNPLVFVMAGFLAVVIALLTVSYQSIKAGMTNPSEALRDE